MLTVFSQRNCSRFFKWSALLDSKRPLCIFQPPPFRGLDATYAVNLRLIAKRVVDFLLIELFSLGIIGFYGWGAGSEYWLKIGIFARMGLVWPKISGTRGRPHKPFFLSQNWNKMLSYRRETALQGAL